MALEVKALLVNDSEVADDRGRVRIADRQRQPNRPAPDRLWGGLHVEPVMEHGERIDRDERHAAARTRAGCRFAHVRMHRTDVGGRSRGLLLTARPARRAHARCTKDEERSQNRSETSRGRQANPSYGQFFSEEACPDPGCQAVGSGTNEPPVARVRQNRRRDIMGAPN